jgi:phospholipase/carboxylesterase
MQIDTNAVLWSAPQRERAGRPLLVLLHGYASHEGDLFQLSPRLPLEPVVASLRAPIAENGGWAWFSFTAAGIADPESAAVDAAARALLDWIDALEYTSISLLGFSQGAAVALQAMRMAPGRFRSIVALSGFVAAGVSSGDDELESIAPAVFWGRGTLDIVISPELVARTEAWLPEHATVTARIYEDLAHSVSTHELADVVEFLKTNA